MSTSTTTEIAARRRPARLAWTWARIQAVSGLVFFVFASLHLVNLALAPLGPEVYNGFQRALRPVYQQPLVELLLVLTPLSVHVVASVARMRARRSPGPTSPRMRAHRYAGYFLLAAMAGHITATRAPALFAGAWPDFEGVAFTFQFLPEFFYPYYLTLGIAGAVHACIGLPAALAVVGVRVSDGWLRGLPLQGMLAAVCTAVCVGWAAIGGLLYTVPDLSSHAFAVVVRTVSATLLSAIGLAP